MVNFFAKTAPTDLEVVRFRFMAPLTRVQSPRVRTPRKRQSLMELANKALLETQPPGWNCIIDSAPKPISPE